MMSAISPFRRFSISKVGFAASLAAFIGIILGITVHVGFFALFALGAFGPGLRREIGALHDLDDFQLEAVRRAGYRSYLTGGFFLTLILIVRQWGKLNLGPDLVPASLVLCLLLVAFVMAFGLSFWDVRQAAALVLIGVGLFWAAFVILSHWAEPRALLGEGAVVVAPFFLGALLARRWPKLAGLLLLTVAAFSVYFFHLYRQGPAPRVFTQLFVATLIPLPLAVLGAALIVRRKTD
jgi:hypothetical protein